MVLNIVYLYKQTLILCFQTNFLGYMVDYIRCTIGLNSEPLTEVEPSDQVTLYHISFVLNTLVRNSSANALKKLRARLLEDFR